mgnify:CR=1 FL=1
MKILKRIGFSLFNLILTFIYFGILVLLLYFSVAPDEYGNQAPFLVENQNAELALVPAFLLILGATQYLTFRIQPDKILEALYAEFVVLKWLTLVWAIFGAFSTWWFYHSSNVFGILAMLFWWGIYLLFFLMVSRITKRVGRRVEKKKNEAKWDHLIRKLNRDC